MIWRGSFNILYLSEQNMLYTMYRLNVSTHLKIPKWQRGWAVFFFLLSSFGKVNYDICLSIFKLNVYMPVRCFKYQPQTNLQINYSFKNTQMTTRVSIKTECLSQKQHYVLSRIFIHESEEWQRETRDNCNLIST